jgi:hypothetical protein
MDGVTEPEIEDGGGFEAPPSRSGGRPARRAAGREAERTARAVGLGGGRRVEGERRPERRDVRVKK